MLGHCCCRCRGPGGTVVGANRGNQPALSARPPGEVRCGRGRGGGGGSRGRGRGLVARVAAAQAASARPQPTAAAAVQAADAVPALEAAAALPVAADVQSHSDECKESPTSLAVPHGKGPACLGATDVAARGGQVCIFLIFLVVNWALTKAVAPKLPAFGVEPKFSGLGLADASSTLRALWSFPETGSNGAPCWQREMADHNADQ